MLTPCELVFLAWSLHWYSYLLILEKMKQTQFQSLVQSCSVFHGNGLVKDRLGIHYSNRIITDLLEFWLRIVFTSSVVEAPWGIISSCMWVLLFLLSFSHPGMWIQPWVFQLQGKNFVKDVVLVHFWGRLHAYVQSTMEVLGLLSGLQPF